MKGVFSIIAAAAILAATSTVGAIEFIHFEDLTRGDPVTGPGVVHPNLEIQPLNAGDDVVVIETGFPPEIGVLLADAQRYFPDRPELQGDEPFPLEVLAGQELASGGKS